MKGFQQQIRKMRSTRPAQAFYISCALAGLHRGWTQSKTSVQGNERLFIDRLAWSALYGGLYAWGHPIVFYCLLQQLEIGARKLVTGDSHKLMDTSSILKMLDVPHKHPYNPFHLLQEVNHFDEYLQSIPTDVLLQHVLRLEI